MPVLLVGTKSDIRWGRSGGSSNSDVTWSFHSKCTVIAVLMGLILVDISENKKKKKNSAAYMKPGKGNAYVD